MRVNASSLSFKFAEFSCFQLVFKRLPCVTVGSPCTGLSGGLSSAVLSGVITWFWDVVTTPVFHIGWRVYIRWGCRGPRRHSIAKMPNRPRKIHFLVWRFAGLCISDASTTVCNLRTGFLCCSSPVTCEFFTIWIYSLVNAKKSHVFKWNLS